VESALEALVEVVGATGTDYAVSRIEVPEFPQGRLSARSIAASLCRLLPEQSILCVDSGGGGAAFGPLQSAISHTWLNLTGGSIGLAGPAATGAAIACPDRTVVALVGDGAAMYTNQAFWTQAREGLSVISVIFSNRRYGILDTEYRRLGVNEIGEAADSMFSLQAPELDFVAMARSMGVAGRVATTAEEFTDVLREAVAAQGPFVIDARM
jgi:acetolactate synthase-1/2/3 large subunit